MTRTLLRAGALGCALLASTALTTPAFAQANQSAQPAFRGIDENGVDLVSGSYPFSIIEGTIGPADTGIAVTRTGTNAYGTSSWQNIYISQSVSGAVRTAVVTLGDRSETFRSTSGGTFVSAQGNGATLSGGNNSDFTYRDGTGTTYVFGDGGAGDQHGASNLCSHAQASLNGCFALATSITRPDGAQTALSWDVPSSCATVFNPDGGLDCSYAWRMTGASNSFGYALAFTYASNGSPTGDWFKRSGATLSNGSATSSIGYNYVSSSVTEITDTGSRVWRITTGTNSLGLRRPGSASDDISVTFSGGVVTQVVRDGVTTSYSRSISGGTATWTITRVDGDPGTSDPQSTVVVDLAKGRVTSVTDPLSRTTSYTYDGSSRLTRVTQPEGNYVNYTYDGRGNVTETRAVAKSGSGLDDMVTSASYASSCTNVVTCNQPNSVTDVRGNVTDYAYDGTHGGVTSVTAPAPSSGAVRPQTRYAYTLTNGEYRLTSVSACATGSTASPTCVGTADESRTVIGYDANGNATSVERRSGNSSGTGALSATEAMTYDGFGNLLTVDGPLSGSADTVRYRYNASRQVVGLVGPDPDGSGSLKHRAIRTTYGTDGLPTKIEQGTVASQSDSDWTSGFTVLQEAQTEYDTHHRPVVQRLVSGGTTYQLTQASYDGLGRLQCTAQRMSPAEFATASLPSDACTQDTAGSFGPDRIARTSYDTAGQVTKIETGVGVTGVAADEMTASYRANGQVETVADANGNLTTYVYDGHDRLSRTRMPSLTTTGASSTSDYEELTYLTATVGSATVSTPLVASRRLRDTSSIAYSYDNLGRLTAQDLPATVWYNIDRAYTYDNMGRLASATGYGDFAYAYDVLGRPTSETSGFGSTSYQYDLAGRRTRLTWTDGFYVAYDRHVTGEVTAIRENGASSGAGVLGVYAYDDLGRRTSLTRGNGLVTSYGYDAVSRLNSLTHDLSGTTNDVTFSYSHDPAGGIASMTRSNDAYAYTGHANGSTAHTADGLNRLAAIGGAGLGYDTRGNANDIPPAATLRNEETFFGYTATNAIATVSSSTLYRELIADSAERLHRYYDGGANRWFLYDGAEAIAETNSTASAIVRRYVPGPNGDEPLVWYEGSGTTDRRWLHQDERGSVIAVSNGSGALVGSVNRYDEYGVPQGTLTGRFGYTGQMWLPEVGLYHYRARAYNPAMGRFMQTDPIGFQGGMNVYAYVGNDPVNFVDPLGLSPPPDCRSQPDDDNCVEVTGPRRPRGYYDFMFWEYDVIILGSGWDGQCKLPLGVTVSWLGDNVFLKGELRYIPSAPYNGLPGTSPTPLPGSVSLEAQQFFTNSINGVWTGQFGRFNVTTNMRIGAGGGTVYVSPEGSNGYSPAGGGSWFQFSDNRATSSAFAGYLAAHEFGHGIGLVPGVRSGHDPSRSGIMSPEASGRPTEQNIADIKAQCH